jgi:hypothetical protein
MDVECPIPIRSNYKGSESHVVAIVDPALTQPTFSFNPPTKLSKDSYNI